jgi:voltage-gated sodium channel
MVKKDDFPSFCRRIVGSRPFEFFIILVILLQATILGLETNKSIYSSYSALFQLINGIIIFVFILEALTKMVALHPNSLLYFKDGWNLFDFSIIVLSLIPFTGGLSLVARLVRLIRVLRLVSVLPQLRLMATTLIRSIPSMFNILVLLLIIFYIYGILGFKLFSAIDHVHWGDLSSAFLTLFKIVTLEGWADIMMAVIDDQPFSWIYFVSFVILGTFIVVNLFIAVVISNLEDAKIDDSQVSENSKIISELKETRKKLEQIEKRLRKD